MLTTILLAFFGGFLPSFVWLFFWLMEDYKKPEPKYRIALTFMAGAAMVLLAVPLEHAAAPFLSDTRSIFMWATIEEVLKFFAAAVFGLVTADYDEPIDALIYTITAALGFAAAENALFLYDSLTHHSIMQSILVGDTRFVGSTLLHTISSACIGIMLGLTFYKSHARQTLAVTIGVILSVLLHVFFNVFILQQGDAYVMALVGIWIGVVIVLLFAERIKRIRRRQRG